MNNWLCKIGLHAYQRTNKGYFRYDKNDWRKVIRLPERLRPRSKCTACGKEQVERIKLDGDAFVGLFETTEWVDAHLRENPMVPRSNRTNA